jgi:hypothetical protein
MPRLCSDSSRPYPGRSVRLSRDLSSLYKQPVRPLVYQAWAHGIAANPCERTGRQTARKTVARLGVIPGVIGQKSAEAIVAKCPG